MDHVQNALNKDSAILSKPKIHYTIVFLQTSKQMLYLTHVDI